MRILAITNMYPTPHAPGLGTFVEQQIESLKQIGVGVDVVFVDRVQKGVGVYLGLGRQIRARIKEFHPDLAHVMYGGVMADEATQVVNDWPTVVSFCGADLLGEPLSRPLQKLFAA